MDRRKSLKLIAGSALAGGAALAGCNTEDAKKSDAPVAIEPKFGLDRSPDELKYEKELLAKGRFFSDHELATITVLANIIIPKDNISGSASDAGVPAFIDFIVQDMPQHQTPMQGGLRWLDMQCVKRYEKAFKDCSSSQQIEMVDQIAYPEKAKPDMKQGVAFFNLMRDLTVTGFFTSEIGVKDMGYEGNRANKWNGVPDEILKQYNVAYTDKEINESVKF
jgi:hypothetical protein